MTTGQVVARKKRLDVRSQGSSKHAFFASAATSLCQLFLSVLYGLSAWMFREAQADTCMWGLLDPYRILHNIHYAK